MGAWIGHTTWGLALVLRPIADLPTSSGVLYGKAKRAQTDPKEAPMTLFKAGRWLFTLAHVAGIKEGDGDPPACEVFLSGGEKVKLKPAEYTKLKGHLGPAVDISQAKSVFEQDEPPKSGGIPPAEPLPDESTEATGIVTIESPGPIMLTLSSAVDLGGTPPDPLILDGQGSMEIHDRPPGTIVSAHGRADVALDERSLRQLADWLARQGIRASLPEPTP
ncbi:MAG: hypothetical protein P4L84_08800 [Isosphaeraceae bacterium]|nr:hypothetical protein [Isosphaeraceae bacterium]